MSRNIRFLGLLAASLLFACGGPAPTPAPDAGTDGGGGGTEDGGNDGGGRDAFRAPDAAVDRCASPRAVTLVTGPQTLTGTTTGMPANIERADGCGGSGTDPMGIGQELLAVTLPGTAADTVGIILTMAVDGTAVDFDTIVEIRPACESSADAICIDDGAPPPEYRSVGTFSAEGGSTLYMIITGYRPPVMGFTNMGPWAMEISAFVNPGPPTFTSGEATLYDGDNLIASATGMDPAGAAGGLRYTFLDAMGTAIGFDLDGVPATPLDIEFEADFVPAVTGMTTFTGMLDIVGFSAFPQAMMATQVRASVLSAFGDASNELTFPLVTGTTVGLGATCNASARCADGLTCETGVCAAPPAIVTACAGATAVVLTPPAPGTSTTTTTVMLDASVGVLEGSCLTGAGMGDEGFLTVVVPPGTFDLLVDTNGAGTADTDTLVYDRTTCADPSTETGCNDDDGRMPDADPPIVASYLELLNVAEGSHTLVIDTYTTLDAPVTADVTIRLRPVLATGAMCDLTGVMNRCSTGACMDGSRLCP